MTPLFKYCDLVMDQQSPMTQQIFKRLPPRYQPICYDDRSGKIEAIHRLILKHLSAVFLDLLPQNGLVYYRI